MRDSMSNAAARRHPGEREPSLTGSLEQLVASSQAVVTKRIDLALLEGQEVLSRTVGNAALLIVASLLGAVGWIAAVWALVQFIVPWASELLRLAIFAGVNVVGAVASVILARSMFGSPVSALKSKSDHDKGGN